MVKSLETLGERLRYMRNKKNHSQQRICDLLKISKRTVQNHEKDENQPHQTTLEGYASLYDCSWQWLLTGKETYQDTEKPVMSVRAPTEKYTHSDLKPEEGQRERFHAMLDTILDGGDIQLIKAISSNLEQFVLLVRQERRLRVLERKAGIEVPENETDSPPEQRRPS